MCVGVWCNEEQKYVSGVLFSTKKVCVCVCVDTHLEEVSDVLDLAREGERGEISGQSFSVVGVESLRKLLH